MNNRVIKFRVIKDDKIIGYEKLTETGWQWMCPELNPDDGERWVHGVINDSHYNFKRDLFTGLTDKRGVEIYECDLVIRTGTFSLNGKPPSKVKLPPLNKPMKVFFHEGQYKIKIAKDSTNHHLNGLIIRMAGIEIIGNIYQNPELLKSKDTVKGIDDVPGSVGGGYGK